MENESNSSLYSYGDGGQPPTPVSLPLPITLSALCLVGFVGNVCMMYVILAHRHMRTTPNILIFNLAVADLLYILIPTPFYIKRVVDPRWYASLAACKVKAYMQFFPQYASAFALAALSRDRHAAIVGRHRGAGSWASSNWCVVVVVWAASALLPVPSLVFAHIQHDGTPWRNCRQSPTDDTLRQVLPCLRLLFGFVIPLLLVAFYYLRIAVSLYRNKQRFQNASDTVTRQAGLHKRLAVYVLIIIIFFALCWFPFFFYFMGLQFRLPPVIDMDKLKNAAFITPIVNTCLDPWLLFVISSKHRACLVGCLCRCWPWRGGRGEHDFRSRSGAATSSGSLALTNITAPDIVTQQQPLRETSQNE